MGGGQDGHAAISGGGNCYARARQVALLQVAASSATSGRRRCYRRRLQVGRWVLPTGGAAIRGGVACYVWPATMLQKTVVAQQVAVASASSLLAALLRLAGGSAANDSGGCRPTGHAATKDRRQHLLRPAGRAATSGRGACYVRPAAPATIGRRLCCKRRRCLLRPASDAATSGGGVCYVHLATVLPATPACRAAGVLLLAMVGGADGGGWPRWSTGRWCYRRALLPTRTAVLRARTAVLPMKTAELLVQDMALATVLLRPGCLMDDTTMKHKMLLTDVNYRCSWYSMCSRT
ncbi:uncharacterized protein [Lolium perenne]|uniref:uncharacterized protein isoform X2 n=1 Tax=Lolium perenne TaxID=4522 RepID=UPI0021F51077|nr:uncharacterized protein LOC127340897 isoform X2 [Lolium perenne]